MSNLYSMPLPQPEKWRKEYLDGWEELIRMQRQILEAQLRLVDASETVLKQLRKEA